MRIARGGVTVSPFRMPGVEDWVWTIPGNGKAVHAGLPRGRELMDADKRLLLPLLAVRMLGGRSPSGRRSPFEPRNPAPP